jgi:hypothetical protein
VGRPVSAKYQDFSHSTMFMNTGIEVQYTYVNIRNSRKIPTIIHGMIEKANTVPENTLSLTVPSSVQAEAIVIDKVLR